MFCKPPHPVYIVLFRGDDTDFVGNQEIIVKITTERDISSCKAYFKYMGNIQTFDAIPEDKELHLVFSREQTKEMPLGTWDAELYLIDENGKRMTVNNRIHMLVTNSVREAYFPDDPQAVSVVISANKYIEDAEVSADGKTLTLTKKDGTEVSFSGGGSGGGTNDYNDLENKPSINGTTLTGNINLATPEQLSLKADKANVYTKEDVDSRYSALNGQIGDISNSTNILSTTIDQHISDTNNPHKVTAAQVGALPLEGGTLTGDLAVGATGSGSRKIFIASDAMAEGISLQGGTSSEGVIGSYVSIGGSANTGATLEVKGGGMGGGTVIVGASSEYSGEVGGNIFVQGTGASIKKDGKEVATEDYVNTQVSGVESTLTTLAGAVNAKLDKTDVVAPSDSATEGQAADAKAVNDALKGKVDNVDGVIKNSLIIGPEDVRISIASGKIYHGYFDHGGISLAVLTLPKKNGTFALTSDIEDAVKDKADRASLAPEYSPASAYAVGSFVYHDGNIYQCTTAIAGGGEAWNAAHWEMRKLDDFFTESTGFTPPTSVAGALKNSTLEKSIVLAVTKNFGDADNTYYGSAT